jgi:catechol 2,3-dioxygenase-like lactoylglutathione lyase family enzyme
VGAALAPVAFAAGARHPLRLTGRKDRSMKSHNPNKLYPLIVTDKLEQTKRFYSEQAGFRVVHDRPMYLQVAYGEGDGPELAFMRSDAFPDGKRHPAFDGQGVIVSIPTPDADRKYAELERAQVPLLSKPEDRPWGWRSFFAADPNGLVLDFFHVYAEASG